MTESKVIRGSCHHDCPDTCVWDVTVEGGRAVRLRGNSEHPTTRGQLCPKVNRFLDRVYHPDRLLTPLRRSGPKGSDRYEPISWDTALGEITERLNGLIGTIGAESILQYSFDGTQGVIQKGVMADRFFNAIGASDVHRHLCGVTAWLGASDVSGTPFGMDPEDLRFSRSIILWGTNTQITNRHLWPYIEEARDNGAVVTVIDPIRTATADKADSFIQIRPGTDVALVLAMIAVMDRDGLLDDGWLDASTTGWDELRESAHAQSLDELAEVTGINVGRIEALAHTYVGSRPSAIRVLVGPEHREHGRDIMRAVALLPAVTGAWRDVGGGLARSTQVYFDTALNHAPAHDPPRRRFNMSLLGETLMRTDLDPPIRALVVHNSNPAVICPDQNRVIAGLEREDLFTVVIEQFMTDTARYADIVLPATTQLEHLDLGVAWGHLYLSLNKPAIAPLGESLPNTEIFRRLGARMGLADPSLQDDDETLVRELLDSDHLWLRGITFDRLVDETWVRLNVPRGERPYVDTVPDTVDGRLTLGPLTFKVGAEAAGGDPDLLDRFPLALLSRKQHPKFLNANYGGFDAHLPQEKEPQLQMHPVDADARGVDDGDEVEVFNDRGALTLRAILTTEVPPGVVAFPFGWWNRGSWNMESGNMESGNRGSGNRESPRHRSVNALTNPRPAIDGTGSAAFHDTLVEVRRAPSRDSTDAPV